MILNDERRKIINSAEMCKDYKFYLNEINKLNIAISTRSNFNKKQYIKQRKKSKSGITIALFILFYIFYIMWFLPNTYYTLENMYKDNGKWENFNTDIGVIIVVLLILGIFFPILINFIVSFKYKSEAHKIIKQNLEVIPSLLQRSEQYKTSLSNCVSELNSYSIIPERYWYYGDILGSYITNCRANTLSETINLLETELHNQTILNMQRQQAAQMGNLNIQLQRNNRKLDRINRDIWISHWVNR